MCIRGSVPRAQSKNRRHGSDVGLFQVISAFLSQGDEMEEDPLSVSAPQANAYEFQSGGIVDMLEKLKDKFEGDDKDKIEKAVQEALDWLDKNQLAEKDEFEAKQKELEGVVNPIMMKVYQAAGGGGMPEGGMPGGGMPEAGGGAGPTVEEVD